MFGFFRKKRISQYVLRAREYISFTFKPEPERPEGVRYSLPKVPRPTRETEYRQADIQYSISDTSQKAEDENTCSSQKVDVKYSIRDAVEDNDQDTVDDIPNSGDRFVSSLVKNFLSENATDPVLRRFASRLDDYLDLTFVDMVTRYINRNGWRDSRVYKAAQMDRRLFSKIMSDRNYKPSKDTALALAIALELSFKQADDLLARAGYTLSHSNKRDVIIEYFIRERIYNLQDINEVLYNLGQKIIGR